LSEFNQIIAAYHPLIEFLRDFMVGAAALLGFWLAWKPVNAATRQADAALKQSEISINQADSACGGLYTSTDYARF
jgi:hypothetical protein